KARSVRMRPTPTREQPMKDELVSKVQAFVERHADGIYWACERGTKIPDDLARAVIPVVLEAAAEVAEDHGAPAGVPRIDYDDACKDIAASIRNLAKQSA